MRVLPPTVGLDESSVAAGHLLEEELTSPLEGEIRHTGRAPNGGSVTVVRAAHWEPDRHRRSRFRRLASRRRELRHPAAIPVRDFGEEGGRPYMVADPYPEATFSDILARDAPLPPSTVIAMLAPVADALDEAHRTGLVHRALSSESLLADGDRLLLDLFAPFEPDYDPAMGRAAAGDPRYRPPEELRGEPPAPAANVYSLAAIAFHALSGAPPFTGERVSVMYAHVLEPPPRLTERMPEFGRAVDDVLASGLAKEPLERPPTATALVQALDEALATESANVPVPARRARTPARPKLSQAGARTLAAIVTAALLGVLAAAIAQPFGGDEAPAPAAPAGARAVERLDARRVELRDELAAARTPADQAQLADELAAAYGDAAAALPAGPLARAVRTAATAYAELGAATRTGSEAQFSAASEAVDSAEARLSLAAARR
jgi:hypothetical protein